jgi:hypothetical protein
MPIDSSGVPVGSLLDGIIDELQRRGMSPEIIKEAKNVLSNKESKNKILEIIKIDKDKIEKATEIKNRIQSLTTEIVGLRYRINEASKIIGKRLFEDNSETSRISNILGNRTVTDQDQLHLFIDDLHKYIVQSANWDQLFDSPHIHSCLKVIKLYRNSFDHIYDMKGSGQGAEKAYKELGKINTDLLGHKVIKIEEYPTLQIEILERVKKMLMLVEENIEDWLITS